MVVAIGRMSTLLMLLINNNNDKADYFQFAIGKYIIDALDQVEQMIISEY